MLHPFRVGVNHSPGLGHQHVQDDPLFRRTVLATASDTPSTVCPGVEWEGFRSARDNSNRSIIAKAELHGDDRPDFLSDRMSPDLSSSRQASVPVDGHSRILGS